MIDEHKTGTVNPFTKIILFFTSELNSESSDTQVRPARANQHLTNTHKTAPKNRTRIPVRQNREAESFKTDSCTTPVKISKEKFLNSLEDNSHRA